MKLIDLQKHLNAYGCHILRDEGKHTMWINPATNFRAPVPRHREIKDSTAKRICKQLGILLP